MKKYKSIILSSIVALSTIACDDYLDINTSPNAPAADIITPDLSLSGALNEPYMNGAYNTADRLGNAFMQNWAFDVNNVTGGFQVEYNLNITSSFYSSIWDRLYRDTSTLSIIEKYGAEDDSQEYNYFKAIAMIMKVNHFQTLVDLYGDIPYSEAHLGGNNTTPTYDDDQAIYRDFIVKLDQAIALIDNTPTEVAITPDVSDVVFGGNMESWKSLANTIKLRVLLRESTKAETNGESQAYLNSEFAKLDGQTFVSTDVTLNPGYNDTAGSQSPFFGLYGYDAATTTPTTIGRQLVVSDYRAKFMSGEETQNGVITGVSDSRLAAVFETFGGQVIGPVQGVTGAGTPPNLSKMNIGSGLLLNSEQDYYVMTASESYFLQAEAMARGYITGDAQTAYNTGISSSFALLGASELNYIDNINIVPGVGFGAAGNLEEQINAIMTQKWIALMGIDAVETWIDYTRTGYPAVPLAATATKPARPKRLMYPQSEYTANSANVPVQSQADAFNNGVFWNEN
jgi:hypothetical protein